MITDNLKTEIATYIKDSLFDSAKIGLGGNATNPSANDLDVPLSSLPSLAITKTLSDLNVIEVKVTVSGNDIQGKVIRELGLFNGSNMVYRINFEGVGPFSTTEVLELFVLLEVE